MSDKAALYIGFAIGALAISYLVTHRYTAVAVGPGKCAGYVAVVDTFTGGVATHSLWDQQKCQAKQ